MSKIAEKPPKRFGSRYPWDQWFRQGRVTLRKGTDFHCTAHGMMQNARLAASRAQLRLRIAIHEDGNSIDVEVVT